MKTKGKFHSEGVVNAWPELFDGVRFDALPLEYVNFVLVSFNNSKIWKIELTSNTTSLNWSNFEQILESMSIDYTGKIKNFSFSLNATRLKSDVEKATKQFFKTKNLQ